MRLSTLSESLKHSLAHMGSQYFDVWVTNVFLSVCLLILPMESLIVLCLCYGSLEGISLCHHSV